MSFKLLTDNQILALAIDEWLIGLDDEDWEEALLHIEKRKRQRAKKKNEQSDFSRISFKIQEYINYPTEYTKPPIKCFECFLVALVANVER